MKTFRPYFFFVCVSLLQQYFFYLHKQHTTALKKIELSDKEIKIIKFLSKQYTSKEIAEKMHVSPRTVDGYRDAMHEKLDVKSRVSMAIFAIRKGIVSI